MREKHKKTAQNILVGIVLIFSILISIISTNYISVKNDVRFQIKNFTYSEFINELNSGNIESVDLKGDTIFAYSKEKDKTVFKYLITKIDDPDLVNRLLNNNVQFKETQKRGIPLSRMLSMSVSIMLIYFMFKSFSNKGGGIMGVGKSRAKEYNVSKSTGVTFHDIAGEDEAKESLMDIVDQLHNPEKYKKIGARMPKGALLVGPPGTGKTLLAKAVAGEAKVPFYSLTGSDFVEMFVGVGASRVRDLFKKANQTAPCIIFIDEIDAIGKSRNNRSSSNDEREQTLNQLLSEMAGFDPSKGIIVLGATNRPEVLDKALLRPGRFDRRVIVEKPDLKGRIDILKVHSKSVLLDESVDLKDIALATSGVSGADLANMVNEAAINAAKSNKTFVSQLDLMNAVETVLVGKEKKDRVLSPEEKKVVAYHEIGHALATAVQKNTEPVQKITIIPRTMGALGYVMQAPEKEKYLNTKAELEEMIVTALAGRAAEEVFFHAVTTGAANDIEKATNIARAMVTQYGMCDKFGLVGFASIDNQYLSKQATLNCGDITAAAIDDEIVDILKRSYDTAKQIILSNRNKMIKLAEFLIEKETITGSEFMTIFNEISEME